MCVSEFSCNVMLMANRVKGSNITFFTTLIICFHSLVLATLLTITIKLQSYRNCERARNKKDFPQKNEMHKGDRRQTARQARQPDSQTAPGNSDIKE